MKKGAKKTDKTTRHRVGDLKHKRGPDFRRLHSNSANVATTFFDMMIMFGEVTPNMDDMAADPVIEEVVAVTMSWEHAKALSKVLAEQVKTYEDEHGEIRTVAEKAKSAG